MSAYRWQKTIISSGIDLEYINESGETLASVCKTRGRRSPSVAIVEPETESMMLWITYKFKAKNIRTAKKTIEKYLKGEEKVRNEHHRSC